MSFDEQKFQQYINDREAKKEKMNMLNAKYNDVKMTFGKYKGQKLYNISQIEDRYCMKTGQKYLTWVSNNIIVEDELLKEAIEFYKDYYYPHGDGYD